MVRPDKWWDQRESVVRNLIYKKRYKSAYKISSEHALSSGSEFAEAEWLSGWIALTFLKSPEYAISHFQNFYNNVGYPISLARGAYWLGITYKTLGDKDLSNKYFNEAAKFPMTYYGQLSFNEIKPGENFEQVHGYEIGEPVFVTPAIDAQTIYFRGQKKLWAFRRAIQ